MMCAQHGWAFVQREEEAETKFFFLKERPNWEEEYQYKPRIGANPFSSPKQYRF
jgi:hypothetical protein